MASKELAPAWLACAQCETSQATLECLDEELLYCVPCSSSLHSKKARHHHSVKRFRTCDECEAAVARVQCASCAGRQSEPLVFCVHCSALLHSKKARHHHQVESIPSSCRREGVSQKAFKEGNAQKPGFNTAKGDAKETSSQDVKEIPVHDAAPTKGDAKETLLQDVKEIPVHDAAPCTKDALTSKQEAFQGGQLSNTLHEFKEATTNDAGLMNTEMTASITTQEAATTRIDEAGLAPTARVCETATVTEEAPMNMTLDATLTQQAFPANTQEVIQNKIEEDGLSKKTPAAIVNTQDTSCCMFATQKAFMSSKQQDAASPSAQEDATSNVAKDARVISNPDISKPGAPLHHFPYCTPPFLPRHYFAGPWPNAFHGAHYNATCMPPSYQAYEVVSPPGCMPHSNQYYTGFIPQVDCSSSAYTPPTFAYVNSASIHSKSDDRHGPNSNKRLRSSLYEVNMVPSSDVQGCAFAGNVPKRTHVGEDATCVSLPSQVYGGYTIRNPPETCLKTGFSKELSEKVEQTGMADAMVLEKGQASGLPGGAISEEKSRSDCFGKGSLKAALPSGSLENMVNEVPPEVLHEKVAVTDVLPERVFATNISGQVSERVSASSTSREELPNVLLPSRQLDNTLASRMPLSGLPDVAVVKAPNEKLARDILSSEFVTPPSVRLDDCIPLREPSSGLLDKVAPIANGPAREVCKAKLTNDRLSSEVLSEIVSPGASPLKVLPKMAAATLRPKEEPVDIMLGEDVLFEFAGSFSGAEASPEMTIRSKVPGRESKKFVTKQKYTLQESTIAWKYFTKKEPINSSSQVSPNHLPHASDEKKETSRDSSEPSYHQEDSSADDETFNPKKYRRGTVTLEAVVRNGDVHDASCATTGHIYTMLKRGLRCSTYDDDARQAVRNAQRRLTKYNLKQASAAEGCLQNAEALKTGWCMVELVPTGSSQRCYSDCWTNNLAHTVAKYFASDFCAQKLKVVFYGIVQNAYCAGHAFAATFNRIAVLSADYVPEKLLDEGDLVEIDRNGKCASKSVFCRKSRMAYRSDLVQALYKIAKRSRHLRAVKLERGESVNRVGSHVSTRQCVWMEGVPVNASLVKRYGNETMEALMIHCRKACKAFVKTKNWTIVASKLKEPILW